MSGFYSSINVVPESQLDVRRLIEQAPFETESGNRLHVTTCYSEDDCPISDLPHHLDFCKNFDKRYPDIRARALQAVFWPSGDNKKEGPVVLLVKCPECNKANDYWDAAGFKHTFSYNPHITLGSHVTMDKEVESWIKLFNLFLRVNPTEIGLAVSSVDYLL